MGTKRPLRRKANVAASWVDALFTATQRRVLACLFAEPSVSCSCAKCWRSPAPATARHSARGIARSCCQAAVPYIHLCFAFEPERAPEVMGHRDLGLLFIASGTIPVGVLLCGGELAEQWLRRPMWMLTPSAERLRSNPFIREVLERPRVWVFGSEARLEAAASGGTWAGVR